MVHTILSSAHRRPRSQDLSVHVIFAGNYSSSVSGYLCDLELLIPYLHFVFGYHVALDRREISLELVYITKFLLRYLQFLRQYLLVLLLLMLG